MVMVMVSGIKPHETKIIGGWIVREGNAIRDENCHRIESLTQQCLKGVGISDDGWDLLYQDRTDGRYWELLYQLSHTPGGGCPSLVALDPDHARKKYRLR